MKNKLTPQEQLKRIQEHCFKHRLKIPWNKVFAAGIYTEIKKALPEGFISGRDLYQAIGHHVRSVSYLKRMRQGVERFGLDYRVDGKVTQAEAKEAKECFFRMHTNKTKSQPKVKRVGVIKRKATANTLSLKR